MRNAQLAPIVYPGWSVRFYVDQSVPRAVQAKLRSLGAHLASPRIAQEGGAIRNNGALLLIDCVFAGNSAGTYVSHPTAVRLDRPPPALRSLAGR